MQGIWEQKSGILFELSVLAGILCTVHHSIASNLKST
jgi:hypothetical protein